MSNFYKYIKNSNERNHKNPLGHVYVSGIKLYIKDPLPEHINFKESILFVIQKIPTNFYKNVHTISIGNFNFLRKREVDAIYREGTIYLSNAQDNNYDIMSDLIHEIAHAFEEEKYDHIYTDKSIEDEFISKRKKMYEILLSNNLLSSYIKEKDFFNIKYDSKFDTFLYKEIGYEKLNNLIGNLFISPYASTSLREYFANAFENFFINDMSTVKKVSPSVYKKIINFLEF